MAVSAHIEIIYADHVYTATVYDTLDLVDYLDRDQRTFRFGYVTRYGSHNKAELDAELRELASHYEQHCDSLADPRCNDCSCDDSGCDSCGTHGVLCMCASCMGRTRKAR